MDKDKLARWLNWGTAVIVFAVLVKSALNENWSAAFVSVTAICLCFVIETHHRRHAIAAGLKNFQSFNHG